MKRAIGDACVGYGQVVFAASSGHARCLSIRGTAKTHDDAGAWCLVLRARVVRRSLRIAAAGTRLPPAALAALSSYALCMLS
ncbi:hypothetical protein L2221_03905, partial [Xanthomonas perforans]|nr:hypothetical protein [Xanthomonas perforans]